VALLDETHFDEVLVVELMLIFLIYLSHFFDDDERDPGQEIEGILREKI